MVSINEEAMVVLLNLPKTIGTCLLVYNIVPSFLAIKKLLTQFFFKISNCLLV